MVRKKRQVIIGNSAAAISAVKAIREIDSACRITLVSAENCPAYSPVGITHYLAGEVSRDKMFFLASHFYNENQVTAILGDKAVRLDPSKQVVYLASGREIGYDNLLIATGASPRSFPGQPRDAGILSVWTLSDADRAAELMKNAREGIVIGAGLIGLQMADALSRHGNRLTVLESMPHVLYRNMTADCAEIVRKKMEARGISACCSVNISRIESTKNRVAITLDSGRELRADFVVVSIGVAPNISWLQGSGVKINRGVVVDEFMCATFGNIFAAGDVTEVKNALTGKVESTAGWISACIQGRIAGANMAGGKITYPGSIMENITCVFGLPLATFGLVKPEDGASFEEIKFSDARKNVYRRILISEGRIIGAILVGVTEDAGIIRSFIINKVDVSAWKDRLKHNPMELRRLYASSMVRLTTWRRN